VVAFNPPTPSPPPANGTYVLSDHQPSLLDFDRFQPAFLPGLSSPIDPCFIDSATQPLLPTTLEPTVTSVPIFERTRKTIRMRITTYYTCHRSAVDISSNAERHGNLAHNLLHISPPLLTIPTHIHIPTSCRPPAPADETLLSVICIIPSRCFWKEKQSLVSFTTCEDVGCPG